MNAEKMEPRGGEYYLHFTQDGFYGCRRCRNVIARADSKVRAEGGYAAFSKYAVKNLALDLRIGKYQTRFLVHCAKCQAFVGELSKEATSTGDCLRCNSAAIHYTSRDPPPTSIFPPDCTFDGDGNAKGGAADDDDEDDEDLIDDEFADEASLARRRNKAWKPAVRH